MTIDIKQQQEEEESTHFNDSVSMTSTNTTTAPLSAYVDYTPRRNFMTETATIKNIPRSDPSLEMNGVSLSRQHRAHYFHQLAQQENNDMDSSKEDYMNTPIVRRYHGITNELVSIQVDMNNNNLSKFNKDINHREWCGNDFIVGKHLGSGRFGTVYIATEKSSDRVVALKFVNKNELQKANVIRFLKREIEIQSHLSHPNVLKLYGYFNDNEHICMVLENAPGGSLYDIAQKESPLPENKVAKYMIQVVAALRYIHHLGVIHRDIKPENILIGERGELKLADFGWAVHDRRPRRRTFCGTLEYLPPEMIENKYHDEKVDIWALGIMCYELLVGTPPFEDVTSYVETYSRIIQTKYSFPNHISMNAQQFVKRILRHDPRQRPTLEVLKNHPWLQQSRD
ncbi:kinase-like domain-containing protein [Circinella umbellata]|nr:kinase-like domain-containing protein [Circinella umbellata]